MHQQVPPHKENKMQQSSQVAYCLTPLGALEIHACADGIVAVRFPDVQSDRSLAGVRHQDIRTELPPAAEFQLLSIQAQEPVAQLLQQAAGQLAQYFGGKRQTFDLPLAASGTVFQQQVWQQLIRIPFGQTQSYGELAQHLGNKNAMRAVGAANGRNPIAIIVPCHRVIGADGKLTGYAGGLDRKVWLLQHEQRVNQPIHSNN
jgi:methylated-DNA-[protein]-cysteine S-methyltransferase